ncbi:MAG: PHP domain-containing protein, partial [bacterium]|nr:PHP domain-containing protein [bacterium]
MITHLHVRSNYSLLYGANHVQELVRAAKKMGYRSLALTDINNLYGVHVFCESCRREGIRPILGAEVQDRDNRAVVLARTGKGFSNITELLTRHLLDQDGDLPRLLGRYSEDVFILSDSLCLLSTLKGRVPELYAMVTGMSEAVPALARQLDLPLAASGEVCFVSSADREVHRLLRAIYRKTVLSRLPENDCVAARAYLASPQELAARFALWPEAVRNTGRIGAACRFREIYRGLVFPHYPLPDGQCQAETLRNRALVGARRRYHKLTPAIFDRLEYELDIIISKGFVSYFLLVADITALASRICGRGSAAASLVAYSLGITNVDPIRHNLYFDRFLNPERPDPPDIDIDFAWDERDAVVEKVRERYGIEHCAF